MQLRERSRAKVARPPAELQVSSVTTIPAEARRPRPGARSLLGQLAVVRRVELEEAGRVAEPAGDVLQRVLASASTRPSARRVAAEAAGRGEVAVARPRRTRRSRRSAPSTAESAGGCRTAHRQVALGRARTACAARAPSARTPHVAALRLLVGRRPRRRTTRCPAAAPAPRAVPAPANDIGSDGTTPESPAEVDLVLQVPEVRHAVMLVRRDVRSESEVQGPTVSSRPAVSGDCSPPRMYHSVESSSSRASGDRPAISPGRAPRSTSVRWARTAATFCLQPGGDVDGRCDLFVRNAEDRLSRADEPLDPRQGRVRMRGQVQGARLPGFTRIRVELLQPGRLGGEQGHPVRVHMVRMAGQPAVRVMGDHDVRTELPDVRDQPPHGLIEGRITEARAARGRLGYPASA